MNWHPTRVYFDIRTPAVAEAIKYNLKFTVSSTVAAAAGAQNVIAIFT